MSNAILLLRDEQLANFASSLHFVNYYSLYVKHSLLILKFSSHKSRIALQVAREIASCGIAFNACAILCDQANFIESQSYHNEAYLMTLQERRQAYCILMQVMQVSSWYDFNHHMIWNIHTQIIVLINTKVSL